jgi:uncharacterized membrane protein
MKKKIIPIVLGLTIAILMLPAGWLNTALVVTVVMLGIASMVTEYIFNKGK